MGRSTFVDDFKESLEFTPVAGESNVYLVHPRRDPHDRPSEEMNSEDWDKFEKHIEDAFEQVPRTAGGSISLPIRA